MCGIAGIFAYASSRPVREDILVAMREAMIHRGPDGAGLWLSTDSRVGLAHRRLAIVDLSDAGAQPMGNEDGLVWVTFNGEIYNHSRLREELLSAGHRFRSDHCDTEVIVHGYEQWGIDGLLARLDGDFAFGLWDGKSASLFLARDQIGVKPVYFSDRSGQLIFASEIKAILKHPDCPRSLDLDAMQNYLTFLTTPAPSTMFEGVRKLPPGHYLSVSMAGEPRVHRYWDALPGQSNCPKTDLNGDEKYCISAVRSRLVTAVSKRMMSDVPMGVLLSGGIDSSANVALMSETSTQPVRTFTVGFDGDSEYNEFEHSRFVSRHFRTEHHEVSINKGHMEGYLDQLVRTQDEPLADWVCIPLYFVSKLARERGVKVVQVGEGADEEFSGYGHYLKYAAMYGRLWRPFQSMPSFIKGVTARVAAAAARNNPEFERVSDFLARAAEGGEMFWGGSVIYWDNYKRMLMTRSAGNRLHFEGRSGGVVDSILSAYPTNPDPRDFLNRMIYLEFKLRLPELLLMRVDKITMSNSIEARVPFLDKALVELAMDIPAALKIKNGISKYILKKAVQGMIPDSVIQRKKMGFDVPMANWLRGDFGRQAESDISNSYFVRDGLFSPEFIRTIFSQHRAGMNRAMLIWVLFNLVKWHDHWFEQV
jgi:asparagine synthase (glutamine-hydrolysing)